MKIIKKKLRSRQKSIYFLFPLMMFGMIDYD